MRHRPQPPAAAITRLKRAAPLLAAVMAVAVATSGRAAAVDPHAGHHAPAAAAVVPTPGKRWATDAPLRRGMANLRTVIEALGHGQHGHLDREQTVALARQVEGHVSGIIADCALEPQADAALHAIIAPLLQGAAALRADPKATDAVDGMRAALAEYARRFDDPTWNTLAP